MLLYSFTKKSKRAYLTYIDTVQELFFDIVINTNSQNRSFVVLETICENLGSLELSSNQMESGSVLALLQGRVIFSQSFSSDTFQKKTQKVFFCISSVAV